MRLLLDTNVLLLVVVGSLKPEKVGGRRLEAFDMDDFALVAGLAVKTPKHISTPHILAEVSNYLGSGDQKLVDGGTRFLAEYISRLEEIFVPAQKVITSPEFHALGLTDAAIHHLADTATRVVSVDYHLCNRLSQKGVETVNPYNFRSQ